MIARWNHVMNFAFWCTGDVMECGFFSHDYWENLLSKIDILEKKTAKTAFNTESKLNALWTAKKLQICLSKYDLCSKCVEDTLEDVNLKLVGREKFKVRYKLPKIGRYQFFWSNLGLSNQLKKINN